MFKNYFYLRRSVYELNNILNGVKVFDIYSQEKNILFLSIPCEDYPNRHLLISTNPQSPFLIIKNNHNKAKKNVFNVFIDVVPTKIKSVSISENDRVINVSLSASNLYLKVMGNKTNIYIKNKNRKIEYFKKSEELKAKEFKKHTFSNCIHVNSLNEDQTIYSDVTELKKQYPMISSEIKNEILVKIDKLIEKDLLPIFKNIVDDILIKKICVGFNNSIGKTVFVPESFELAKSIADAKYFTNFNDALQYYLSTHYKQINKSDLTKELTNYFVKELSSLSNKLNKLTKRIVEGPKDVEYSNFGSILLANIYKIKKGMSEIYLDDLNGLEEICVKLDPKFNSKQNIDKYFEKSRDEKVNFKKSQELFNLTRKKYDYLLAMQNEFSNLETSEEIEAFSKKVIPKKENIIKMETGLKFKYWHYLIDEQYNVYVGRDSKSNDYLSMKFAKQNDYWFHARGLPGSHVVLRVDNVKEGVPKPIIKKAAAIAAYHSKAKTAGTASVSYTFAKFVYKKKGMTPGKVILTKESTILVRPGIPKNCEIVNE